MHVIVQDFIVFFSFTELVKNFQNPIKTDVNKQINKEQTLHEYRAETILFCQLTYPFKITHFLTSIKHSKLLPVKRYVF